MITLREFIEKYRGDPTLMFYDLFVMQEKAMAAIDTFNASIAALSDTVANKVLPALQEIPALRTSVTTLQAQVADLQAQLAAMQATDPVITAAATTVDNLNGALVAAVPPAA